MSPLTVQQAEALLSDADLAPCLEGGLNEMKELVNACLSAGIPAILGAAAREGEGYAGRAQLVVRIEDLDQVRGLLRDRWLALIDSLGVDVAAPALEGVEQDTAGEEQLRCPACGTAGPLVDGACSDCGLQLE